MGKHPEIRLKQRAFTAPWTFQLKTTSQNSTEVFNYTLRSHSRDKKMIALIGVAIPKDFEGSEEYFKIVPER